MNTITLQEARARTGLDLLGDDQIHYSDRGEGTVRSVASGQREMAGRHPLHEEMVEAGQEFFASLGFRIYPNGLTVNGVGACPDFAAFGNDAVIFVECLTAHWTNWKNVRKKSRISKHGRLAFIVEHPEFADMDDTKRNETLALLAVLSKAHQVFLYHPGNRSLTRMKHEANC